MTTDNPKIPDMHSYEEIGEFWDTHSLADYWDQTETAEFVIAPRLNKKILLVTALDEEAEERAYWRTQTPRQRLIALEQMRQILYNYDPHTTRLQRVFTIIDCT